jgi:hypothetical protein
LAIYNESGIIFLEGENERSIPLKDGRQTMKMTLDHRDSHLCVLYEFQLGDGSSGSDGLGILREWYPVREATEGEVAILVARPVNSIERDQGLYADEEGNPYQLSEQGRTRPLAVEMTLAANDGERAENKGESGTDAQALAEPMAAEGTSTGGIEGGVRPDAWALRTIV